MSKAHVDERIANARTKEDVEAEKLLKALEKLDPASAQFSEKLAKRLEQMGRAYEAAKALAPTHPHPSVPNAPVAQPARGTVRCCG